MTANISMMIEEFDREQRNSPQLREMAEEVRGAAAQIGKIVLGLKTFSRADEERRIALDLLPLLDLASELMLSQVRDRVRLVKRYGESPWVEADEARLGQVFINLLMNAAQALPPDRSETSEIQIATTTDASGRAVVEIRDNGSGISVSAMPRIFDPFFTTKAVGVGTGLGLSICHSIVTGMGGEISAESVAGSGTTFRVVLPGVAAKASVRAAAPPSPHVSVRATILVVDDEASVGLVLARVLRDHDVTVVSSAKKAIQLLDAGRRFDIIFSDLMMPEMSGMDLHDELAQRFPDAARCMVFMSGGAFTPSARAFLDRVSNRRMDKPFDPSSVRSLVQRQIELSRAS